MITPEFEKYGLLLNGNLRIHRQWFREMVKLYGVWVLYRAPYANKHWTTYAELESNYQPPIRIGVLFDEHPRQNTTHKKGWIAELQENTSIIHVDYDLKDLQIGALFIIPSAIDGAKGRLFRVIRIFTDMIYPDSVACEIAPEYEDTIDPETLYDYSHSSFNFLNEEDDLPIKDAHQYR